MMLQKPGVTVVLPCCLELLLLCHCCHTFLLLHGGESANANDTTHSTSCQTEAYTRPIDIVG